MALKRRWVLGVGAVGVALAALLFTRNASARGLIQKPPQTTTPGAPPTPPKVDPPGNSDEFYYPVAGNPLVSGDWGWTLRPRYKGKGRFPKTKKYYRVHRGCDIGGIAEGTALHAVLDGEVIHAGPGVRTVTRKNKKTGKMEKKLLLGFFGIFVLLKVNYKGRELYCLYAHCSAVDVKKGDKVKRGEVVARAGNTGNSMGVHLHFEVWRKKWNFRANDNHHIDPIPFLKKGLNGPVFRSGAILRDA